MIEGGAFDKSRQKEIDAYNNSCIKVRREDYPDHEVLRTAFVPSWKPTGEEMDARVENMKATHAFQGGKSTDDTLVVGKDRLVVLGNEDKKVFQHPVDAPSASPEGMNVMMHLLAEHSMPMCSADVTKAYLKALATRGGILLRPPPEAGLDEGTHWLPTSEKYGEPGAGAGFYTQLREATLKTWDDVEGVELVACARSNHARTCCMIMESLLALSTRRWMIHVRGVLI
jgi:hypothetical protein